MTEHLNGEFVETAGMAPPAAAARGVKNLRFRGKAPADDGDALSGIRPWPVLPPVARHGLAGEFARLATECSEADQVAVMLSMLTGVGALMGRARYLLIDEDVHHARLMAAIVGGTAMARKGTSWGPVKRLLRTADNIIRGNSTLPYPLGLPLRIDRGPISSGEGLIEAIRDKMGEGDAKIGEVDAGGTDDKRLLIVDGELGAALRAMQRQGSTTSMILRSLWDGDTISPLVRHNRVTATEPHVCIVAHITGQELAALLGSTDIWGGLANRLLWACVRRQGIVPQPRRMGDDDMKRLATELARVVIYVCEHPGQMRMSNSATDHYVALYPELTQERPGPLGAITTRAAPYLQRLALTYALVDGADHIALNHVEAAAAMWRYCDASAVYLFGGVDLDPIAQKIVGALGDGPKTQTEIRDLFGRHQPSERLKQTLAELQGQGRITLREEATGGRPRHIWSLERGKRGKR
jgi:hypothetical protein